MSPALPKLPDSTPDTEGESPTAFKNSLLNYLKTYKIACLEPWLDHVKRADFSEVKYVNTHTYSHRQKYWEFLRLFGFLKKGNNVFFMCFKN